MPPKKITTTPAPMTDAQLKALIAQGVADALAEIKANKTSRNGDDSHDFGTHSRRTERAARECTYSDFLQCQPLNFKGTEGVGSVMASKPKTMQDAIEFETELMDQKIRTLAERQTENKRKFDDTLRNNQNQQQLFKRHNVAQAYTAEPREKKLGLAIWPETNTKLDLCDQHPETQGKNQRVLLAFECGASAISRVIARGTNPNFNVVTDHGYDVELADEIGSFDVIIGMDWLSEYHAVIVYDEKIIRIPFGNEILIFHGCHVFLAHVTTKKAEDKSEEKRHEDVPIVRDFPEVFPEDFPAAIQLLKEKLCSAPILALPEGAENFIAYCDGLLQKD
ncbi:hypothetical protein Tco_0363023 [Tanacetum coccineum]